MQVSANLMQESIYEEMMNEKIEMTMIWHIWSKEEEAFKAFK